MLRLSTFSGRALQRSGSALSSASAPIRPFSSRRSDGPAHKVEDEKDWDSWGDRHPGDPEWLAMKAEALQLSEKFRKTGTLDYNMTTKEERDAISEAYDNRDLEFLEPTLHDGKDITLGNTDLSKHRETFKEQPEYPFPVLLDHIPRIYPFMLKLSTEHPLNEEDPGVLDHEGERAIFKSRLDVDIRNLKLSRQEKDIFALLVGNRFNKKSRKATFVSRKLHSRQANENRVFQMFDAAYYETKRLAEMFDKNQENMLLDELARAEAEEENEDDGYANENDEELAAAQEEEEDEDLHQK